MKITKLKYSKPLLIISICLAILGIISIIIFSLGIVSVDILVNKREITLSQASILKATFVMSITVVLVSSILQLVAGVKSRNSKGWNTFLIVCSIISIVFRMISLGNPRTNNVSVIFGIILDVTIIILAAMNLSDFNVQTKELARLEKENQIKQNKEDL